MNVKKIGFIGTGVMGGSMAKHLLEGGYHINVYTRTKEKATELLDAGASWYETPAELAADSDVVITMVGFPSDVEEVYIGTHGILKHAKPGTYFIDMTTSSPSLAIQISREAEKRGMFALDAPVSGGDVGAKNGTLTIMVGGEEKPFQDMMPILTLLGQNIVLQGSAGSGQHTKMCNQIAIASNMVGVCEALAYAKKTGLDPEKVLTSISAGAAGSWSLSNLAPRIINDNFEPGFYIKHFIKDMKIAIDEAEKMNLHVPGLSLAKQLYESVSQLGEENSGTQALFKLWNN
ncbi:3-hydroxyisobutyrate dehydrogenase [Bacillus mesophilus]|uniref:NAD(P)-dependent oxidoreductase n=1 Tax=Bacillus mesophilus TaxID=1808955 RepID=A0A6M0Q271_9BACI|nr:NAD(P)-dependent oxidoreductase [Bacillus mesophilus]MBM7659606.1 3-hydroxyisobutyrate dehydrogenase [Bacillus mesophilus]NEY70475.1 NAD(P)-dependent oxidoreductase [Bacillus mesophilus]